MIIKKYVLPILTVLVCVCFMHMQTAFADDLRVVVSDETIKEVGDVWFRLYIFFVE